MPVVSVEVAPTPEELARMKVVLRKPAMTRSCSKSASAEAWMGTMSCMIYEIVQIAQFLMLAASQEVESSSILIPSEIS